MLLTPTYHVFDMFKVHMDAKLLPVNFNSPDYTMEDKKIPAVNVSASRDSSGGVHISLVNLDPNKKITIRTTLVGVKWQKADGQILKSGKLTDINSFEKPNTVAIQPFKAARKDGNELVVDLPAQSVVTLSLRN
jgi:alpha-N-arabinofuranosidase